MIAYCTRVKQQWLWLTVIAMMISFWFGFHIAHSTEVALKWDASTSPNVTEYRLHYGGATGQYTSTVSVGHVTTAILRGLTPGYIYFITATAHTDSGAVSVFSNEVVWTAMLVLPVAPSNVTLVTGVTGVTLRWSQPTTSVIPVSGYTVYKRAPGDNMAWVLVHIRSSGLRKRWLDTALLPRQEWCYHIRSITVEHVESLASEMVCGVRS